MDNDDFSGAVFIGIPIVLLLGWAAYASFADFQDHKCVATGQYKTEVTTQYTGKGTPLYVTVYHYLYHCDNGDRWVPSD